MEPAREIFRTRSRSDVAGLGGAAHGPFDRVHEQAHAHAERFDFRNDGSQTRALTSEVPPVVGRERARIIRDHGELMRSNGANQIERRLHARALALGSDEQKPVVLIAAELVGISEELTDAVAAALQAKHGIARERVAICTTHTHTGPVVGVLRQDREAGIMGVMGESAEMIPVEVTLSGSGAAHTYKVNVVRHTRLSPLMLAMVTDSVIANACSRRW